MSKKKSLVGKVALITGASRGIGKAIAEKIAEYEATAILCARSEVEIKSLASGLREKGLKADAVRCDVSSYKDVSNAVKYCSEEYGSLDILVNNAAVIDPIVKLAESNPEEWCKAVDINYKGVYFGLRAAIPVMKEQKGGTIINLSSGAANSSLEGWSHYCSTKAASKMLTECAHHEYASEGIRVLGLRPGTVATDMMNKVKDSGINPVSQLAWDVHFPAEWVGEAVAFLCTSQADPFLGTDFSLKTEEGRKLVGVAR